MAAGPRLVGRRNRLQCNGLDAGICLFGCIEVDHRGSRVHLLLGHRKLAAAAGEERSKLRDG